MLQSRLTASRQKLTGLRDSLRSTVAEARTATIYLTLTTEEIEPGAVGESSPLDDIKNVLAWEAIALLYSLVVAGPFLILGFLVWLALRLRRRHVATRLLEQNSAAAARPDGRADATLARDMEAAAERFHRSRRPGSPDPPPRPAPPTPSSETSTTRTPSSHARSTWARLAAAYFATFASDSETT